MSQQNLATIMRQHGASAAGLDETMREIEAVKAVRFAWHPWMPLNNFGADTFRFNVPYAELPRLEPIALTTVQRPVIHSKARGQFGLLGVSTFVGQGTGLEGDSSGFGGSVLSGAGAHVSRVQQRPEESIRDLLQAYTHYGMTHLDSMGAADERELTEAYVVYEAVMGEARSKEEEDAGRRPVGLLLEDFPNWLSQGALEGFRYALQHGVSRSVAIVRGNEVAGHELRRFDVPKNSQGRAEQLISEIRDGILRAEAAAIGPENGILVKTRKAIQTAKNGGMEGKNHKDSQDLWLEAQYPSFDMDTDVERANRALQTTLDHNAEGGGAQTAALLALAQQMVEQGRRQDKILEALARQKGGKAAGDGA